MSAFVRDTLERAVKADSSKYVDSAVDRIETVLCYTAVHADATNALRMLTEGYVSKFVDIYLDAKDDSKTEQLKLEAIRARSLLSCNPHFVRI